MGNERVISIKAISEAFCPKCGNFYLEDINTCPHCNITLNFTDCYQVERKCSACGTIIQAPPDYFMNPPKITPCCGEGVLEMIDITGSAPSFVIDGKFNGANRGRMIKEKNEQLKKKHAGYSYETPESIRSKTERVAAEKKKGQ